MEVTLSKPWFDFTNLFLSKMEHGLVLFSVVRGDFFSGVSYVEGAENGEMWVTTEHSLGPWHLVIAFIPGVGASLGLRHQPSHFISEFLPDTHNLRYHPNQFVSVSIQ